eukprot:scaffold163747_cov17-Prasinocladus_malaysianus.AAC.5
MLPPSLDLADSSSAPCSTSSLRIELLFSLTAASTGSSPVFAGNCRSAPRLRSLATRCGHPLSTARYSGLLPSISRTLTSAPCSEPTSSPTRCLCCVRSSLAMSALAHRGPNEPVK